MQDQAKLGNFVLTLGGRQDWLDQFTRGVTYNTLSDTSDHAFTGRAGLTYVFGNGVAPYVSYAESFTPQNGTDINGRPLIRKRATSTRPASSTSPPASTRCSPPRCSACSARTC